jgi:phosphate uptake regulator
MNTPKQIKDLRVHLLDMSKLSQRAVDYAIKGYRLGSPEFCRHVRYGAHLLGELRRKITDKCRIFFLQMDFDSEALMDELALDAEKRFPLSALRICDALHAACTAAAEIAQNTMLLLEDSRVYASAALEKVCSLVSRLMGLCIVALFKKEIHHAEAVLHNRDIARSFEQAFDSLRADNRRIDVTADLEFAIARSLGQIARHAQEIAEAIIFWLDGKCALESSVTIHS